MFPSFLDLAGCYNPDIWSWIGGAGSFFLRAGGAILLKLVQFPGPICRYFAEAALDDLYGVANLGFCR